MSQSPWASRPRQTARHFHHGRNRRWLAGVGVTAGIVGLANAAQAERPDMVRPDRFESRSASGSGGGTDSQAPATRRGPWEPPWLELGMAPAIEVGRHVFAAVVISPFLTIRTWEGLRLGASLTPAFGIEDGLEGCSTVAVCNNSRSRASGRAEYQFNFTWVRPWLAVEVGREQWKGVSMLTADHPEVSGVRTVVTAQAGLDAVVRGTHKAAGIGLFGGFSADDDRGIAIAMGLRLTLGPY